MADYRVDPEGVLGVADALSAAADSGPSENVPSGSGCGSQAVEAALADDGVALASAWCSARDGVFALTVGAVRAADAYRETEASVADEARREAGR